MPPGRDKPSYEDVSMGRGGFAEVIQVEYDPAQVKFSDLLNVFFAMHDPTTLNRQGNDAGIQYRSVIFYTTPEQKAEAEEVLDKLEQQKIFDSPILTEVKPLDKFYEAEKYHQKYYDNNSSKPYCQIVIDPKVAKLRQKFAHLLKE